MPTNRPWWLLPPGRIQPLWWVALGAVMLWIDYLSPESAHFPAVYIIPIILTAWYSGKWPAVSLAIAVPVFRLLFLVRPSGPADEMVTLALATVEGYISRRSEAQFSHGVCPSCTTTHYPDIL